MFSHSALLYALEIIGEISFQKHKIRFISKKNGQLFLLVSRLVESRYYSSKILPVIGIISLSQVEYRYQKNLCKETRESERIFSRWRQKEMSKIIDEICIDLKAIQRAFDFTEWVQRNVSLHCVDCRLVCFFVHFCFLVNLPISKQAKRKNTLS